jgi:predicted nucleic acid-binding protein
MLVVDTSAILDAIAAEEAAPGLAETLEAPLITCDGRLASSSGHDAEMELFEVSGS